MLRWLPVLLVLGYFVTQHDASVEEDKWGPFVKVCEDEVGIKEKHIDELMESNSTWDKPAKCLLKCFYDKLGVIDSNGQIELEKLVEVFAGKGNENAAALLKTKCNGLKGDDDCDTVYQTQMCITT